MITQSKNTPTNSHDLGINLVCLCEQIIDKTINSLGNMKNKEMKQ
jgi:hypothetical protein